MQINKKFLSNNYSKRSKQIKYIVIHYTEMLFQDAIEKLCDTKSNVSSHYLIKSDGAIFELVATEHKAWHAGISYWKGDVNINEYSIGIELDNLGDHDFSKKQMLALRSLCKFLIKKYNIDYKNVIGHSDVAPERKIDPGIFFDWYELAKYGIGQLASLSQEKTKNFIPIQNTNAEISYEERRHVSISNKNYLEDRYVNNQSAIIDKLMLLGYNPNTPLNHLIRAFQSHFYPQCIIKKGIDYYRDNNSKYEWNNSCDELLDFLIYHCASSP